MSVGVNMAKTGNLLIHEPLLATMDPANSLALMRELPPWEQVRFLRFPGFYVDEGRPDEVIPQFYTLHPLWIAVAYSLGGLHAALLMTPLWGVLGVWAVYMVGRRLLGAGAAWLRCWCCSHRCNSTLPATPPPAHRPIFCVAGDLGLHRLCQPGRTTPAVRSAGGAGAGQPLPGAST
ncbi:MAG: hypothetical protein R3A10_10955 [Caldilineaceae bacterium]